MIYCALWTPRISFHHSVGIARANFPLTSPHTHENLFEIYHFESGNVKYQVGREIYNLRPNTYIFIPPGVKHTDIILSSKPYIRSAILFSDDFLPERLQKEFAPMFYSNQVVFLDNPQRRLAPYLELFCNCTQLPGEYWEEQFLMTLVPFLRRCKYISENGEEKSKKEKSRVMYNVLTYIDTHYREDITLEKLENLFFSDRHHLNRLFRTNLHTSIYSYILYKRMDEATKLIEEGTSPTKVAEYVGFKNYSSFYRQYVRMHGTSPSKNGKE